MKNVACALAAAVGLAALILVLPGCGVLGGPPTGVTLGADSDSTVQVVWNAPAEGNPDNYLLYFRPVNDSSFGFLIETDANSYVHKPAPAGMTGVYKVVARFGSDTYEAQTYPTSVPIHTDSVVMPELNADTATPGLSSGFGWSRDSGTGRTYSMADGASATTVDFYVSDLDTGHGMLPYVIIGPSWADTFDRGAAGVVPTANWRVNGFSEAVADEQAPLPAYTSDPRPNYFEYANIQYSGNPVFIACYTAGEVEKHYALIKVRSVDPAAGRAVVETWYQLITGLRLIRH
jgi:hypothetical protein